MAANKGKKKDRELRRRLLDLPQAAEYLQQSHRWMRRAVAEHRLSYLRCGALLRFDPDDLDAYLAACRVEART